MKAIKQVMKKDQEPYRVPKRVQDAIPIKCMWRDGIFLVGTRYSKTFKFTDINYMVASQESLLDAVPVCIGSKPETNGQKGLSPRNRE